ncbi:MAG: hypothetical protein KJ072_03570 [Verrucomicrobia bacterium]|nr:hypothetical protein [Verrucomicrobiota bacterium]
MIGSIILGAPIVWTAFKDLGRGSLNTSALVALAVFALFASAHYQEAGIVAFFMLLGQIIETRTAEGAGDEVFAGTVNLTGLIEVRVHKAGEDTTLNRVRDLILAVEKTKLPITRIIDHYMGYYTPLILVIGALVWAFTHDLNRVVTVFIVACPCAFVLATPTALVAALSAGARLGILIKNVADLESAGRINAFVFDKTGTLTEGRLVVSRLTPLDGPGRPDPHGSERCAGRPKGLRGASGCPGERRPSPGGRPRGSRNRMRRYCG